MKDWTKEDLFQSLVNLSNLTGYHLTSITKLLDKHTAANDLSRWMDTIYGHSGGWYHRVKHGHDFLANVDDVYKKFGLSGVLKYPGELLKDASTPHGIPFPGVQTAVNQGLVGAKNATLWASLNIADLLSGSVAIYSTYRLHKKSKTGELGNKDFIWATIGSVTKVIGGTVSHNPILIISGLTDSVIILQNLEYVTEAFDLIKALLLSKVVISSSVASAVGAGVAAGTVSAVAVLGTASTGTAISSLSGIAATNATLAAIGGGSLATGGLGIAGGVAILSGGGAIIAVATGYGIYRYLKKKSEPLI